MRHYKQTTNQLCRGYAEQLDLANLSTSDEHDSSKSATDDELGRSVHMVSDHDMEDGGDASDLEQPVENFYGGNYREDDFDSDGEDFEDGQPQADSDIEGVDDDATFEPAAHTIEDLGNIFILHPSFTPPSSRSPSPSPSHPSTDHSHSPSHSGAISNGVWHNPVVVRLTAKNPGAIIGYNPSPTYEAYKNSLNEHDPDNLYAPYKSKLDWEFANWAKSQGCGSTAVTELLSIEGVCHFRYFSCTMFRLDFI